MQAVCELREDFLSIYTVFLFCCDLDIFIIENHNLNLQKAKKTLSFSAASLQLGHEVSNACSMGLSRLVYFMRLLKNVHRNTTMPSTAVTEKVFMS